MGPAKLQIYNTSRKFRNVPPFQSSVFFCCKNVLLSTTLFCYLRNLILKNHHIQDDGSYHALPSYDRMFPNPYQNFSYRPSKYVLHTLCTQSDCSLPISESWTHTLGNHSHHVSSSTPRKQRRLSIFVLVACEAFMGDGSAFGAD